MALSNQQIIDSLLQFYKNQGTDLTYMLSDPVFDKMPIEDKIEAIKRHAGAIHQSSPSGFNKEERGSLGFNTLYSAGKGAIAGAGAATAALAALGLMKAPIATSMGTNRAKYITMAIGAGLGTMLGSTTGLMNAYSARSSRLALRNQLGVTAKNPNDVNSIGSLSINGLSNKQYEARNKFLGKIEGDLEGTSKEFYKNNLPPFFIAEMNDRNNTNY